MNLARPLLVLVASATIPTGLAFLGACGSSGSDGATPTMDASTSDVRYPRLDGALHPDASCLVTIETPPLVQGTHVQIGTPVTYNSNPPASGPHYPLWAAFQTFATPVPRPYYVHDLEHGAIVFLYKCDTDGGCADVVSKLESVVAEIPTDRLCAPEIRVRRVITPDPLIDVPIAAAAWGWTYKAACLDLPTLKDFALAHYAQGPEDICPNGETNLQ